MFPRPHRADRPVCPPDSSFPVRLPTMHLSMIASTRVFPFGSSLTVAMLIFSVQAVAQTTEQAVTERTAISQPAPSEVSSGSTPAPAGVFYPALTLPAAPSFGHLFSDTVKDFRQMASRDTFTWLSIGGAAALAARPDDSRLSQQLSGAAGLTGTFRPGQTIGSAPFQLAGALAAYSLGRAAGSSKTAWLGADLFRAQILVQTVTQVAKMSVGRTRPDGSDSFSFPSGHTSSTFASATVLQQYYGWKAGIPAYAVAS